MTQAVLPPSHQSLDMENPSRAMAPPIGVDKEC